MKKRLGKYELVKKIGEGATSTVYLANDPFAGRQVAIKVATAGLLSDPAKGKRYAHLFLNEAALVGKLKHPHIVQIYDAVVTEDLSYIVMEYIPGETLDQHTTPATLLPIDRVVELIFKATLALNFAQRAGITHRDIKPANLLLSGEHDLKLTDFGAALDANAQDLTQVRGVGSPPYMSPEQLSEHDLDHRTDIYSLGVVMFQLLTGKLPFFAENTFKTIYRILNDETPLISSLRPGLALSFDRIAARAMAKDRDARYQTWDAFAQDLVTLAQGLELPRQRANEFADTRKFTALRAMPFFGEFSDVEIWEVIRFAEWRRIPAGTIIMRDGDTGNFFCFLAQGQLAVSKHGQALRTLATGDCFGEMAVIRRQSSLRSADIIASMQSDIVCIRSESLHRASESCRMRFYQGFMETLANRLMLADQRIINSSS